MTLESEIESELRAAAVASDYRLAKRHACGCVLSHKPAQALADLLKAAVLFEQAVKAYSAWNTRPSDSDEYEQRKYDAMKSLFAAVKVLS